MKKYAVLILSCILGFAMGCGHSSQPFISSNVGPVTVASAPTAVAAAATSTSGSITLTWTASAGATSYTIYYGTTTGVTTTTGTKITGVTGSPYTVTGLANGTPYYFIITAVNSAGESTASTQTTATPVSPIPAAPTALTATAGNGQVSLTWAASTSATSYTVYYATTSGVSPASPAKYTGITGTSTTVPALTNGVTYYFVVTASNAGGESTASNQASATPVAPIPAAPTALTATAGDSQVMLNWTGSANATSYTLYYGTATGVTMKNGTPVKNLTGTSYTLTNLMNGTSYYFVLTAVNATGESLMASNEASATPSACTVTIGPSTPATSCTLNANTGQQANLTFNFPADDSATTSAVNITTLGQMNLPAPLARKSMANAKIIPQVSANDTFIAAFTIATTPTIASTNFETRITGTLLTSKIPVNTTLNLAYYTNNAWTDVATFIVGANQALNENLGSFALPGVFKPGDYLVYEPAQNTSTAVSNLGVALIADDGSGIPSNSTTINGLQVVHIYDANGNLLTTPTVTNLGYATAYDLDGQALTPDGSQGIMVDGGNTVRFFSGTQTGTTVASTNTLDITNYGGDGDSIGILPTGDEAIVSGDNLPELLVVSGILSGKPVAATTITLPAARDGVTTSADGKVLLARGPSGLTVIAITPIVPTAGSLGGTVSHSYLQLKDFTALGGSTEDGRDGMALSPTDSNRAVVVSSGSVQLLTGLTTAPVAGTALTLPSGNYGYSVSVTPDGKYAVVGTSSGLLFYSGVDTGTLTQVGNLFAPMYTPAGTSSAVQLSSVYTLGITLDGKYVLAGDIYNRALVVIPYTAAGFGTPAAALGNLAIPYNDQLLVH